MADLVWTGMTARCLEPDALGRFLMADGTGPGRHFLRFFDEAAWDGARAETAQTGALGEAAACALVDGVLRAGEPFGGLDVPEGESDTFPARFLELVTLVLDDEPCAQRLLDGGVLDRLGRGRHFLGSLPLRVVARQYTASGRDAARARLQGGWDEDLLNLLESAALRATHHPEDLLVLVPTFRAAAPVEAEAPRDARGLSRARPPGLEVGAALAALIQRQATDLELMAGGAPTLRRHGEVVGEVGPVSSAEDVEAFCSTLLEAAHRERLERDGWLVHGFSVEGLGPLRLSVARTATGLTASVRAFHVEPRLDALQLPSEVLSPIVELRRGLVVVAAPPGQGRTTLASALLEAWAAAGRSVVAFDEPACLVMAGSSVRHVEPSGPNAAGLMRATARALPVACVGVDLVDDTVAADVALDLATEGRLVVLTQRSTSSSAVLHRLAPLDAARHRRRLSESLAAMVTARLLPGAQGLVHAAELLRPSDGLRRHLRGNETPVPPILLEPEGLSLDDRLLAAHRRGALTSEGARQWLTDARRLEASEAG
jgi:Tfp pilus assembly pilus retraction ATPase PilT